MNSYYLGVHYEKYINDVLVKLVSSFHEAKSFISSCPTNQKILMFYQKDDITPEEHMQLQTIKWNLQIYSIINNFNPEYLDNIAKYLYNIYSCIFATSALSTVKKLSTEHIQIANIVLNNLEKYIDDDYYISSVIIKRCYESLKHILNNSDSTIIQNFTKIYSKVQ